MDPYFEFDIDECQLTYQKPVGLFSDRSEWKGLSFTPKRLAEDFYFISRKAISAEECENLSKKWEYPEMFHPVKELIQGWNPESTHKMYLFALRVNLELLNGRIPRDSIRVRIIRKKSRDWKAGITSEIIDDRASRGFYHKIRVNIYEIDEPDAQKRLFSYFGDLLGQLVNVLFCYYCCKCITCKEVSYKFDNRGLTSNGLPWQVIARTVEALAKERMDIDVDLRRSHAMAREIFEHELLGFDLTDDSKWDFGEWSAEKIDYHWFGMDLSSISRHIRALRKEYKERYRQMTPEQQRRETSSVEFMKSKYQRS